MLEEDTRYREEALLLTDFSTSVKDPSVPNKSTKYTNGWRFTVVTSIILSVAILILNLALTIWSYADHSVDTGVATIYRGQCNKTKNVVTVLHLAICILSTLLLGASNYCIQILTAPTRHEIDATHTKHKSLSIGVTSFGNLFHIDRKRLLLCIFLAISSIPLHLLWNSAFLDTLSSNEYIYSAVTESFLAGSPWNTSQLLLDINQYPNEAQGMLDSFRNNSLTRMDVPDCIKAYGVTFNSQYSHVLLVYPNATGPISNDSLLLQGLYDAYTDDGSWVCEDSGCSHDPLAQDKTSSWNPFQSWDLTWRLSLDTGQSSAESELYIQGSVQYCLVERTWRPCQIDISPPIIVVVLICNAIKIVCFVCTIWLGGSVYPIMTNGDAIQSFLLQPDRSFQNRCLASRADIERDKKLWSGSPLPMQWRGRRQHWAKGATTKCWLATFIP